MTKIRLCVFDMDGLLIDSESVWLNNALECNRKYGYGIPEELVLKTMGNNNEETRRRFLETMGASFPYDEFIRQVVIERREYLKIHPLEKKKGLDELFDWLEDNDIRKALATSTGRVHAIDSLESVNIADRFDHIVLGDDLKESKPRPEIYLKAISPFPYEKDEILAFEDSGNGILSACGAGLRVVYIPDLAYVSEQTKEKSFTTLNDLSEAIKLIEKLNDD